MGTSPDVFAEVGYPESPITVQIKAAAARTLRATFLFFIGHLLLF